MKGICTAISLILFVTVVPAHADSTDTDAQRAIRLSTDGLASSLRGDFATASTLYRQAYALDPSPEYLYSAARSEHQAGQCEVAVADYSTLLQLPNVAPALRVKGAFHLADAKSALAENRCFAVQTKPASQVRAHLAFSLIGVGSAAVIGATALWLHAHTDQQALDGYRDASGHFRPDTIGPAAAIDAQSSINERTVAAWSLFGVGAVAGGVATWLLLTGKPSATQVSVTPAGVGVAGKF